MPRRKHFLAAHHNLFTLLQQTFPGVHYTFLVINSRVGIYYSSIYNQVLAITSAINSK